MMKLLLILLAFVATGDTLPGTGENIDRSALTAWTNPGNILTNNNAYATLNATGSDYLVARNFGFNIPSGSTINGITVKFGGFESSSGGETMSAQLQDASGALFGSAKTQTLNSASEVVITYGANNDLWGATITEGIIEDADFGVRIWYTTAHNVSIDYVTISVEYTEPVSRKIYVISSK